MMNAIVCRSNCPRITAFPRTYNILVMFFYPCLLIIRLREDRAGTIEKALTPVSERVEFWCATHGEMCCLDTLLEETIWFWYRNSSTCALLGVRAVVLGGCGTSVDKVKKDWRLAAVSYLSKHVITYT